MKKFFEFLASLFKISPSNAKNTLKRLDPERLRRERIKAEQAENQVNNSIEQQEQLKAELFAKGVDCASDRQKTQYARKIKQVDGQIRAHERHLSLVNRNIRVISGLVQIKENEQLLRKLGMDNLINDMDLSELHQWVEEATIEGRFQMEKFEEVLGAIAGAEEVYEFEDPTDEETQSVVAAMGEAAELKRQKSARVGLFEGDSKSVNSLANESESQKV